MYIEQAIARGPAIIKQNQEKEPNSRFVTVVYTKNCDKPINADPTIAPIYSPSLTIWDWTPKRYTVKNALQKDIKDSTIIVHPPV